MSMMKTRQEAERRSIAEQAAEWLLILEDAKDEDQEAFAAWLARSPLHVGAFLRASAVDRLGAEIDPERSIEVEMGPFVEVPEIRPAAAEREEPEAPAPALLKNVAPRRRSRFGMRAWALAAGLAALVVGAGAFFGAQRLTSADWKRYTADVGEQRVLELEDGSVLYLGPGSSIEVSFTERERRLHLVNGEAMFQVRRDRSRPFRVHSGRTVVEAVGTRFNVSRMREDSLVSVVEGVVQVSQERSIVEKLVAPVGLGPAKVTPVRLTAGQETRVEDDGAATEPKPSNVDPVKDWNERRLTFINETLFAIADEFNRYNRAPKIRVIDPGAGELRFAAAFDADDPESLAVVLQMNPKLRVERRDGEIVISSD
jgi:transmembrane sensor